MPKALRRRLAAYFTPPHLAHYAIDVLVEAGIKPGQHRILDPASGGAAFLVPLAERISEVDRRRGARAKTILESVKIRCMALRLMLVLLSSLAPC